MSHIRSFIKLNKQWHTGGSSSLRQNVVIWLSFGGETSCLYTSGAKKHPPLPPSLLILPPPAIWIESLRRTLLFSSAQLLERWAPLWRSSTHRGCCCLGSSFIYWEKQGHRAGDRHPLTACKKSDTLHPWFLHPRHHASFSGIFTRRWMSVALHHHHHHHLHRIIRPTLL